MPVNPTPDGPLAVPLHRLARMLCQCEALQSRAGLAYPDGFAEEKLLFGERGGTKRIYYPFLEETSIAGALENLPLVVVEVGTPYTWPQRAGGAVNLVSYPAGTFFVSILDRDQYPGVRESGCLAFLNFVGEVIRQLGDQAGSDDTVAISELSLVEPPRLCSAGDESALGWGYWSIKVMAAFS